MNFKEKRYQNKLMYNSCIKYIYIHIMKWVFFSSTGALKLLCKSKETSIIVTHIDGIQCISVKCRNMKFGILGELDK